MSGDHRDFVSLALSGQVMTDEIDDFVSRWHASPPTMHLRDYLGFTADEYALWATSPDSLPLILSARKRGEPLKKVASDNLELLRMAARPDDVLKIKQLELWLRNRSQQTETA
jgi:hypothetical protein